MSARYTIVLGTKNWSSWSLRPYLALRATGAPFEEIVIQLRHAESPTTAEAIRVYSPAGKVPILKIENGGRSLVIWDSLAICETLAERHPEAQLWPSDPDIRAQARSYAAEMHSSFAAVRNSLSMEFARRLPLPALEQDAKDQIARILQSWETALSAHGKDGGFLFGKFSIADCMYAPVVSRFATYGVEMPPPVEEYTARMFQLPAMEDWLKASLDEVASGRA